MKIGTATPAPTRVPHQPFPVVDFSEGLSLAAEAWLSPKNAFREVTNGRIFRGQLEKRTGSQYFSEVGIEDPTPRQGWQEVSGTHYYKATPATRKIIPTSCSFQHLNGAGATITAEVSDASPVWGESFGSLGSLPLTPPFAAWRYSIVETGTSNVIGRLYWLDGHSTPTEAEVEWTSHSGHIDTTVVADGTFTYWYNPEDEIVGLYRFQNDDGDYSIACDENYLYRYDPSAGFYKQQAFAAAVAPNTFAGPFTGDDEDYFWFWPLDDWVALTNFADPPCYWDPGSPSVTELPTDWTTPGTNDMLRCRLIVRFRGRLLYFNTEESGTPNTLNPTRVRWTAAGSFTGWNSATDYSDAPTNLGDIVTAQFIGERLFVGFEQGWMEIVATGDSILPYEWRPFISRFGAVSKLSTIQDNERLLSRSDTTMQALDPNGQFYFDPEIPDLVQGFSADKTELCMGFRNEDQRAHWWTYVASTDERPQNVLCATYDEQGGVAWSQYDMRFNVFSDFDSSSTPTWAGLGPYAWTHYTGVSWNSATIGIAGFTQAIGGSDKGLIHIFDTSNTDFRPDGPATIEFDVLSQRWVPMPGEKTHWGWVELIVEASSAVALTLSFYGDMSSTPHLSKTVTVTPRSGSGKAYTRVSVDHTATFHQMRIESSDGNALGIDAVIPYFRPAGRAGLF